jgi:hypothetical protein
MVNIHLENIHGVSISGNTFLSGFERNINPGELQFPIVIILFQGITLLMVLPMNKEE